MLSRPFVCSSIFLFSERNSLFIAIILLALMQLLGPEDMVNRHVDELSMMTYLSQFPEAKLKDGAPIKARGDPSKVSDICILFVQQLTCHEITIEVACPNS